MGCCSSALHRLCCRGAMCTSEAQIPSKTVVITGCNTGIGLETAIDLAKRGGRVIMACRSEERALPALELVKKRSASENVKFMKLDLASMASIREFAAKFEEEEDRLDILVNNAGVMACPQMKTADGFEMQMGTNHLGHFLLTNLLLEKIKKCGPGGRIVNLSSLAHEKGGSIDLDNLMMESNYDAWPQYRHSKIANVLFTKELAKRLEGSGVNVYAVHPGVIPTELARYLPSWQLTLMKCPCIYAIFKTVEEGAQTSIHCAVSEEAEDQTGLYYADCKVKEPINRAKDEKLAKDLWELSEKLVNL